MDGSMTHAETPLPRALAAQDVTAHGGVVDSDYRGEVLIGLRNESVQRFTVKAGDRIAQAMLEPVQRITFETAEELSATRRGVAGFGSTGF
jgi:dUTP pyrophosphatase